MFGFLRHLARRQLPVATRPEIITMFSAIHGWTRGEPTPQEYFTFRDGLWYPVYVQGATVPPGRETPRSFRFSVLSWNIDFMRAADDARMSAALKHLKSLVAANPNPSVIMLNEMTRSDLNLIKLADWVREGYNITDVNTDHWESPTYGTCMLLPHALPIKTVTRLHYAATPMQRDALFADVALPPGRSTLRLCTTHLESLRAAPPLRPAQLAAAAAHLRRADGGGVLGGDLNAIESFDRSLHAGCGLRDAYLESGGREGDEGGMTWGQMAGRRQRERFGLGRLDKILFWDGAGAGDGQEGKGVLKLVGFERFGMDVVVDNEVAVAWLMEDGELEKPWVTDHLGVRADFRVDVPEKEEADVTGQEGLQGWELVEPPLS